MYDVCVVGAGPIGSVTALKLGEKKWKVALIEKDDFAGKTNACSGGVEKGIIKKLEIPDKVIEKKDLGIEFRTPKKILRKEKKINYVIVRRENYDRFLAKKAGKKCAYFPSTKIEKIDFQNSSWILRSKNKKFESKIIVFADGASSKLRNGLGIGFKPGKNNFFGTITREFNAEKTRDYFDIVLDKKVSGIGYGWLFPGKKSVNIGLQFFSKTSTNSKEKLDYLIDNYYPKFKGKKPFIELGGIIPAGIPKKLVDEQGLIVVGDAAGFTSPLIGGDGLHLGTKGAFIAIKAIDNALKKNDKQLLLEYEKELQKQDWFQIFKIQEKIIKILALHPILYHEFASKIFFSGIYDWFISLREKIVRGK